MTRRIHLVLGCLIGVLVAGTHEPREAGRGVAVPAAASSADFVRVEHRFVAVRADRRPQAAGTRDAQKAARVTRTDTPRRPFLARAAQLVLGDGRVRPEPFPRPAVRAR